MIVQYYTPPREEVKIQTSTIPRLQRSKTETNLSKDYLRLLFHRISSDPIV